MSRYKSGSLAEGRASGAGWPPGSFSTQGMMMKKAAALGLVGALALMTGIAQAAEEKNFSVGGSFYWIDVDATNVATLDFTGGSIFGTAALNEHVALRGSIYGASWDVDDDLEVTGYDVQLLLGGNLNREGFKYYLALGGFSETLEYDGGGDSMDFSGAQVGLGFGYNWAQVSLDYTINLRSADDYADAIEDSGLMWAAGARRSEVTATSSTLALSLRF
ncbi:outer membrane beta-barrel protein [Pseudomonas sp. B392_1p]|uniref:outer membrane beta-barrel protein n=1 Tax=Pseudomonas sp. B392_1p TaxID=3457507 RepID=UPI003FD44AB1